MGRSTCKFQQFIQLLRLWLKYGGIVEWRPPIKLICFSNRIVFFNRMRVKHNVSLDLDCVDAWSGFDEVLLFRWIIFISSQTIYNWYIMPTRHELLFLMKLIWITKESYWEDPKGQILCKNFLHLSCLRGTRR